MATTHLLEAVGDCLWKGVAVGDCVWKGVAVGDCVRKGVAVGMALVVHGDQRIANRTAAPRNSCYTEWRRARPQLS